MSSGVTAFFRLLPILPNSRVTWLAVDEERAVALVDLARLDVHAALVGVRGRQDVALVEQPLERLGRRHVAEVEQHLVPEARVQQVQHRVLDAADVEVDAARRAVAACPSSTRSTSGSTNASSLVGSR